LKKVQGKKKRDNEAAELKRKADLAAAAEAGANSTDGAATVDAPRSLVEDEDDQPSGPGDLLSSKDEDVIF